jgi:hypothetical protein
VFDVFDVLCVFDVFDVLEAFEAFEAFDMFDVCAMHIQAFAESKALMLMMYNVGFVSIIVFLIFSTTTGLAIPFRLFLQAVAISWCTVRNIFLCPLFCCCC